MLRFFGKRLLSKLLCPLHARGRVIAVMGVDGSGKTTLLNQLSVFLKTYTGDSNKVQYSYMGKQAGHRLPLQFFSRQLNRWRKKNSAITQKVSDDPSLSKEGNAVQTFNRPVWKWIFPIEYTVRLGELIYLIWFRRKIVLTDRYVDDFTQDKSIGLVLANLIKLFPKPSHVFMIVGDAEKFFARKGEYSSDELATMQEKLLIRVRHAYGDRVTFLDGNKPASAVLGQALAALHSP